MGIIQYSLRTIFQRHQWRPAALPSTFSAPGYPAQVTDRLEIIGGQGTIIFENDELREIDLVRWL